MDDAVVVKATDDGEQLSIAEYSLRSSETFSRLCGFTIQQKISNASMPRKKIGNGEIKLSTQAWVSLGFTLPLIYICIHLHTFQFPQTELLMD